MSQGLFGTVLSVRRKKELDMRRLKQTAAEAVIVAGGIASGIAIGNLISDEMRATRDERKEQLDMLYSRHKSGKKKKGKKNNKHMKYYW